MLKVNILKDKRGLNKVQSINAIPGLVSFLLLLFNKPLFNSDITFYMSLFLVIAGLLLIYFPFYLNSKVLVTPQNIGIENSGNLEWISWDNIKEIDIKERQEDFNHNYYKCIILLNDNRELEFYISRYLYFSKRRMLIRLFDMFFACPSSVSKISQKSMELYKMRLG